MSWNLLDTAAVVVLVAGGAYLVVGPGTRPVVGFPEIRQTVDPDGRRVVGIDMDVLAAAFVRAGLPDPPDLNGADPVPVGVLMELARTWVVSRDPVALGRLGQVYQALEEHEAALGCFAAAADIEPDQVLWRYGLGVECQALRLNERAIDALTQAGRLDPDYPTTWARLGALCLEAGDLDAAAEYYEQYRGRAGDLALGEVGLGRVALARGETAQAQRFFRAAVERSPGDFLAHRFLARAHALNGLHEDARREQELAERLPQYSGWLTFDPRLHVAHRIADTQRYLANQMRLAAGARDYESFARIAEGLLQRRPSDFGTLRNLATVYRELRRFDDADAAIERALALKPDSAAAHCVRAEIAFAREDLAAAHRALDDAAAIDPDSAKVLELRGRTYFLQGHEAEAIAAVRKSIDLDPGSTQTRVLLAKMLQKSGQFQEAVAIATDLIQRNPDDRRVRALLKSITASRDGP